MNLVIVESPHKAGTIQKFLGDGYKVVSSKGHIRDLQEKSISVDIEHGFVPEYVVPADKKKTVAELKALAAKADVIYLASDEDREGEAIAWHLTQTLGLDPSKTLRITFHEITKTAILEAIRNPRQVDMNLVDAQQARRVLDRLVGFELSPLLWKKVRSGLSAGRVQSVALRLVVDREREILSFVPEAFYRVEGSFAVAGHTVKGVLSEKFAGADQTRKFLEDSIGASYTVCDIKKKEGTRCPAAPFTTSTLQQEAGHKLHFPVNTTMRIAQQLYERGLITYMRTDSTTLSQLAVSTAKSYITEHYGAEYSRPRQFHTKSKGAQEAHEAIRPTFIADTQIEGTAQEQKLYELIWKRTVASQMSDAKVLSTSISIASDRRPEKYSMESLEILFDGFFKLYRESAGEDDAQTDDQTVILPEIHVGDTLECRGVSASCKFTQAPFRYTQPALVKKLEELGIGRPSTYGTIISTLTSQGRGYVVETDKSGVPHNVTNFTLKAGRITETAGVEMVGGEKKKFFPTDVGIAVTDYLVDNFTEVLDYTFTADVEESFDKIAGGRKNWKVYMGEFYGPFHEKVKTATGVHGYQHVERVIGVDPADGKQLVARLGKYGPYVQKGAPEDKLFASLAPGQLIETISLEDALKLFTLPRVVGSLNGIDVVAAKGKYGPYLKYGAKNISLPRKTDPMNVSLEECAALIEAALNSAAAVPAGPIKEFGDIQVLDGRYGPYIKHAGANYKIPRGTDPAGLTEADCRAIIASQGAAAPKKKFYRKK